MEEPVITDKEFLTSDILFSFAAIGNCNGLRKYLEDDELDPELKEELLSSRDDQGKTALEIATILGRIEILHVLIEHNCNVNDTTTYGYTPLHYAAAWGQTECLKCLTQADCNLQARNIHNERAREMAIRYKQEECVEHLDWAEAKKSFETSIKEIRDVMSDPERIQGRLSRDEKNSTNALCAENEQWLSSNLDSTTQDFREHKKAFDEALSPIWDKLSDVNK